MAGIESLLGNNHYAGSGGFDAFIGQVPSNASQAEQVSEGKGVGNRCRVRVCGEHPFDIASLPDEELPWANLALPVTAGSGAANYATSSVIQQGDMVYGVWLDKAHTIPLVTHVFPRSQLVSRNGTPASFVPGTGYSDVTPEPVNGFVSESNEQEKTSQNTPGTTGKKPDQAGTGAPVLTADTCNKNPISRVANEIEKLLLKVQKFALAGQNLENEIRAAAEIIKTAANQFVGTLIEKLFDKIEDLGKKGLKALYTAAYGAVFAATQSPVAAHKAGVAAEASMLLPTFTLQEAIGCVANAVVEGLFGVIEGLLRDIINTAKNFTGCLAAQTAGAFFNSIIDKIADAISGPLGGISKILGGALDVVGFLLSAADNLNSIASFLDCSQSNSGKCPTDKEYTVGGSSKEKGEDPFEYVMNAMNFSRGAANLANDFERQYGKWDIFGDGSLLSGSSAVIPGGCYAGPPTNCTGPVVEIYGGGGSGAVGKVLMGYFLDAADSGTATFDVNVDPDTGQAVGDPATLQTSSGITVGSIAAGVQRTGSIIGVEMESFGSGYQTPPLVSFRDKCEFGYGASAKAILGGENGDQVVAIVMNTTGENYPEVENPNAANLGITNIAVIRPGTGYKQTDRVVIPGVSPSGNVFTPTPEGVNVIGAGIGTSPIFDLRVDENGAITEVKVLNILRFDETLPIIKVVSETGSGAILKPIFGLPPTDRQVGIISAIDCV